MIARYFSKKTGIGCAFFCLLASIHFTLLAQTPTQTTLDENGITLKFSASRAGEQLDFFAINLGHLGVYSIGSDGVIRLNLSRVSPRPGVCFFAVNTQSQTLIRFSAQNGFRNPFWEQRGTSSAQRQTDRPVAQIEKDIRDFEGRLVDARATLAREEGGRYRNGQCFRAAVRRRARPTFGFEGNGAAIYAASRCERVIGVRPLNCEAVLSRVELDDNAPFSAPQCNTLMSASRQVIAGPHDKNDAAAHEAIVTRYAGQTATDADSRPRLAGQCIAEIRQASISLLSQWREERDRVNGEEDRAFAGCTKALEIIADETVLRQELTEELAAARARDASRPKRGAQAVASRSASAYPCSPNTGN